MTQQPLTIQNALSQLDPKDAKYCQDQYDRYWELIQLEMHINKQRVLIMDNLKSDDFKSASTPFTPGMQLMEKITKQSAITMDKLTRLLIQSIEEYFRSTYNLKFKSFEENNPEIGLLAPLSNHRPIVHNILLQAGPDYFSRFRN